MSPLKTLDLLSQQSKTSTVEALELFDQLDPVDLAFMMGRWRGSGFPTGHPLDGLLEAANWYGKEFVSPDCAHPLLFLDMHRNIFKVAPNSVVMPALIHLALRLPIPKTGAIKPLYTFLNSLQKTDESQARLRMMEYRNQLTATMIYDHLPIHDVFKKVDDNTMLGLMDYKALEQPFFFVLRRSTDVAGEYL